MHLQADVFACAEGAAHPTEDQPHVLFVESETCRDLVPVFMQPLGGDMQFNALATRIREGECGLKAEKRLILHADLVRALDDHVAGRCRVAVHDPLVTDHVAVRVNRVALATDCLVSIK